MKELIFTNNMFYTDFDIVEEDNYDYVELALEDLKYDVNKLIDEKGWLIAYGTIGTWRGDIEAGLVIRSYYDLTRLMFGRCSDCYVSLYNNGDGTLSVETAHHDGTNYFTIKQLNERGMSFLRNRAIGLTDIEKAFDEMARRRKIKL